MITLSSAPCQSPGLPIFSALCTLGSFFSMSISSTYREQNFCFGCADVISMGKPVVCLDQIKAIFEPNPNFPRVCRTPYFVPLRTLPSMLGMSSCAMPLPLSFTVMRKNVLPRPASRLSPLSSLVLTLLPPPLLPLPPLSFALASASAAFASCADFFASAASRLARSFSVSKSAYSALSLRTCALSPILSSYSPSVTSSTAMSTSGSTPMDSAESSEFSMNSRSVVYNDFPAFSNPAMPLLSRKNSAGDLDLRFLSPAPGFLGGIAPRRACRARAPSSRRDVRLLSRP
mmetsp:Transcript_14935/g.64011  ORF Transcript_14935/g.64011 Transcript_14935/m.64011 type:complete len:288 (+) Transcript_14935:1385-2248(+)